MMARQASEGTFLVYLATSAPHVAKTHAHTARPKPHSHPHVTPSSGGHGEGIIGALWLTLLVCLFIGYAIMLVSSQQKREAAEKEQARKLAAQESLLHNGALSPIAGLGIELHNTELAYWAESAQWTEMHSERVYEGGSSGASVRVARGLWVHSGGSRGHSRTVLVPGSTEGTVYLTNKRLIFISEATSHEIKLRSWLRVVLYQDGIEMFFDKKTPVQLTTGGDGLGIVLDRVLRSDFSAHSGTVSEVISDSALERRGP